MTQLLYNEEDNGPEREAAAEVLNKRLRARSKANNAFDEKPSIGEKLRNKRRLQARKDEEIWEMEEAPKGGLLTLNNIGFSLGAAWKGAEIAGSVFPGALGYGSAALGGLGATVISWKIGEEVRDKILRHQSSAELKEVNSDNYDFIHEDWSVVGSEPFLNVENPYAVADLLDESIYSTHKGGQYLDILESQEEAAEEIREHAEDDFWVELLGYEDQESILRDLEKYSKEELCRMDDFPDELFTDRNGEPVEDEFRSLRNHLESDEETEVTQAMHYREVPSDGKLGPLVCYEMEIGVTHPQARTHRVTGVIDQSAFKPESYGEQVEGIESADFPVPDNPTKIWRHNRPWV